jgi:hypothetical protein
LALTPWRQSLNQYWQRHATPSKHPIATFNADRVLHQNGASAAGSIVWFEITHLSAYIEFVHDLDHGFIN